MKPRINVLTLGVADLEASVSFYQALGFETDGIVGEEFEHDAVCFSTCRTDSSWHCGPEQASPTIRDSRRDRPQLRNSRLDTT